MKVQVLNDHTFNDYGRPIHHNFRPPTWSCSYYRISAGKRFYTEMCRYEGKIYIEAVEGKGLIYITDDLEKPYGVFLLEDVTEVSAGFYFCVVSCGCDFSCRIYSNSEKMVSPIKKVIVSQGTSPKINVERLYTILYQEKGKGFVSKNERNLYWELIYMDKGSMFCTIEDKSLRLEQGDLLFIRSNQNHFQKADGESLASFLSMTFDLNSQQDGIPDGTIIHADNAMHQIIRNIMNEYRSKITYNEDMIMCYLKQVIVCSLRKQQKQTTSQDILMAHTAKGRSKLISDCLRIIDENIGNKVTVESIAAQLCTSSSLLSKAFKNETGFNIAEYIRDHRMEKAKDMIRMGDYSITEIADILGFSSICNFSAAFKKKFAVAPSSYSRSVNQE